MKKKIQQYQMPSGTFSNKVTIISFVMSVLVVSIHANNLKYYGLEETTASLAYQEVKIIAEVLGNVAVPFFFMMSGYWFFRMQITSSDVWEKVGKKCRKKIRTLVIPYLLWNALSTAFYMIVTRIPVLASQMNGGEVISLTIKNLWGGVLLHQFYFPFWYLQDLIIITFVLTPFMLLLLRNKVTAGVSLVVLGVMAVNDVRFTWLRTASILMFFIGGVLSVYFPKAFEQKQSKKIAVVCLSALFLCCVIRYYEVPILSRICLYASPMLMWKASDLFVFRKASWFENQSFFVYAAHVIPVTIIGHMLRKISGTPLWAAASYLMAIGLTVIGLYIVAKILNRYVPRMYSVLCGGR